MTDQTHQQRVWQAIAAFHKKDEPDRGQLDFCRRCGCYLRPSEGRVCADCQQQQELES